MQKFSVPKTRSNKISFISEIFILYYSIRDRRTPFHAKIIALSAIIYLISPIDLIPDFIPIAGYLDDLVIVPLLLHVAYRVLPADVKNSSLEKTRKHIIFLRVLLIASVIILIALMTSILLMIKQIFHL